MKCPFCQSGTQVYNSRQSHQATQTWRRRRCLNCNKAFTTREKVDFNGVITVRASDSTAPYSHERLLLSLAQASTNLDLPAEMLSELTDSIEQALNEQSFFESNQSAEIITTVTTTVLARYNKNFAVQYVNNVYNHQPPLEVLKAILED